METQSSYIENLVKNYDGEIIIRRSLATWIDFLFLLSIGWVSDFILGSLTSEDVAVLVYLTVILCYYIILESYFGYTIGKLIIGIRVVDRYGNPCKFFEGLIRTVLRFIEVNPFIFWCLPACIVASISRKWQRLGDIISRTYVVNKNDLVNPNLSEEKTVPMLMWPGYLIICSIFLVSFGGQKSIPELANQMIPILEGTGIEINQYTVIVKKAYDYLFIQVYLAAWGYWMACLYRLHVILAKTSNANYPIKPGKAVWGHLIPWFNCYWVFAWPSRIAHFFKTKEKSTIYGWWLGIPLLICLFPGPILFIFSESPGEIIVAGYLTSPFLLIQYMTIHYISYGVRKLPI